MKNSFLISLLVCAWTVCNSASGEGANLFKLKGVSLGINESEIKKLLPTAVCDTNQSLPKAGIIIYVANDDKNPPNNSTFTFLDGVLIRMEAFYSDKDLSKIGGWEILRERLKQKLGTPTSVDLLRGGKVGGTIFLGGATWNFKGEDTFSDITAKLNDGKSSATFYTVRSSLWQTLKERQKNESPVGF